MSVQARPRVFGMTDYKRLLHEWVAYASATQSGYKARLARAMGTPSSFLSQVLHTSVHFTPDHAFRCAVHWKLSDEERDYFVDLVHLARAGSAELRGHLTKKLKAATERNRELGHRLQEPTLKEGEAQWLFYTHWRLSPICLLLTIPEYAKHPEKIAARLGVSEAEIRSDLSTLEKLGLVESRNHGWRVTETRLHLDRFSPVSPVNHMLWRQKAIVHLMNAKRTNYHYSGLHTLSRQDIDRIREILVDALENCRKVVGPSPEEELVCITCDLFAV